MQKTSKDTYQARLSESNNTKHKGAKQAYKHGGKQSKNEQANTKNNHLTKTRSHTKAIEQKSHMAQRRIITKTEQPSLKKGLEALPKKATTYKQAKQTKHGSTQASTQAKDKRNKKHKKQSNNQSTKGLKQAYGHGAGKAGNGQANSSHLLFGCSVAKDVQKLICRWWNLDFQYFDSYDGWLSWFKSIRLGSKTKDVLEDVFYVSWWSL
nr:RNA-directed DNA polymerase, eukaryota [Tanacetum cinerariifolium]